MVRVIGVLLFWASVFGALNSYYPQVVGTKDTALGKHIRMGFICESAANIDCYLDRETIAKVQSIDENIEGQAVAVVKYKIPLISPHDYEYVDTSDLKGRRLQYTDVYIKFKLEKGRVGWTVLNDVMTTDHKAFISAYSKGQIESYQSSAGFDLLLHRVNVILMQYFDVDGDSNSTWILWLIVFGITAFYYSLAFKGKKVDTEILTFSLLLAFLSFAPIGIDRVMFF
ncbi:MAG: hypothetical protein ACTS9Y_00105 [Methylophilus sp.]|uniref:hypothetical protein n=1 Tax=Methylophilus sp. TaxID=29541 RepID=UPI003F9FCCCD